MNSFFCNAMQQQSLQMFLKIDVLKNFASFTGKHLCWHLFLIKLQAEFLRTPSFKEYFQWLLLWFLQQSNLIFSVITITLGYNQKLSQKYCTYYHPTFIKIFISPIKSIPSSPKILQPFPPKCKLSDPVKHLFLYNFNTFQGEWCIPQLYSASYSKSQ